MNNCSYVNTINGGQKMNRIELELDGLNCAGCAAKIEKLSREINGVEAAGLDFVSKTLKIELIEDAEAASITDEIKKIVNKLEPHVIVIDRTNVHRDEHDHHHEKMGKSEIAKLIIGGVLFILPLILGLEGTPRFLVCPFLWGSRI